MIKADLILRSHNIFTAKGNTTINGFVAIKADRILAVETDANIESEYTDENTKVIDLEDKFLMPGGLDNHTFFCGNMLTKIGVDMSDLKNENDALDRVRMYCQDHKELPFVIGKCLDMDAFENEPTIEALDAVCSDRPVAIFTFDREFCWMNTCAIERWKFTPHECWAEMYWRMMEEICKDKELVKNEFLRFMGELNSKGITSVKDIGHDDYFGMPSILEELEKEHKLTLRVNFVFQPNARKANIALAKEYYTRYKSNFLRFAGFKFMVDGDIPEFEGDLIEPYANKSETTNKSPVNYGVLEKDVLELDRLGMKCDLHAEGDRAVLMSAKIYKKCIDQNGARDRRFSVTDMELTTPEALDLLGRTKTVGEIYSQIMLLDSEADTKDYLNNFIGEKRFKNMWNYRKMADSGMILSTGTDLPLMYPSIPDSIFSACCKHFDGSDKTPFHPENALTRPEMLRAWTIGGQYGNFMDDQVGTIEPGKLADITVFDKNLLKLSVLEIRNVKVDLTIMNGKPVYERQ